MTRADPSLTPDRAGSPADPSLTANRAGSPANPSFTADRAGSPRDPSFRADRAGSPADSSFTADRDPGPAVPLFSGKVRSAWRRYAIMLVTAAVVLTLDHVSKWLVTTHVQLDTQVPAGWPITIHYIENSGGAFGILPQLTVLYLVVAAAVAGYILRFGPSMGGGLLRLLALGCILGGSISNGIDRLIAGYVVDFIDTHFWLFQIFNVADMGIVGGMLVVVFQLGFGDRSPTMSG